MDAGTPDAAVDPDAGVDAGPPRCGDIFPLSDNTVPWANTAFAGRTRFTVDTSMFPTGEPIAVALRLNSTTLPACALQNQVVALSQGTPLPLEVDHVEANGDITFWVQVTASGPYQDVDLYWDGSGAAPSGPSPFAGYVVAWHMTGGTFSHPSWNIQRPASVTSVGGFVGQALGFNGTGQVTGASNVDAFNNETAITMSAWVNRNVGDPNQFEGLVHLRAGNNNDFDGEGATLQLTNQRLAAESRAFTWANDFYEPTLFPVNTWTHVAVCFRAGSVVRVYRDGLRVAESRVDQVITNNNDITPTVIGLGHRRFFGANQAFFFGAVDEVRIENAAHGDAWFLADHLGSTGTVVTWQATELLP